MIPGVREEGRHVLTFAFTFPQMFTERNLEDLWSNAKKDPTMAVQIIMVLEDVAKKRPEIVGKLLPLLADHNDIVDYAKPSLMNVFKQVGVRSEVGGGTGCIPYGN